MDTPSRSPSHIAVVDDDADVRLALCTLLRSHGYRVSLHEGAHALLAAGLDGVDCVVSDVQMPVMDGLELLERLRAVPGGPPCILMTAFPAPQLGARAMSAGAVCFLAKPIDADQLSACIAAAGATPG